MKKDELEDLIHRFNNVQPSELQIDRWMRSIRRSSLSRGSLKFVAGLAAGIVLGFFCAKLLLHPQAEAAEIYASSVNYYYQNN